MMENVNEIMAERATAAGIDLNNVPEGAEVVVPLIAQLLDDTLPALAGHPADLRIVGLALRSYADVVDDYAAALAARPADDPTTEET
jgi:hypothetical protein